MHTLVGRMPYERAGIMKTDFAQNPLFAFGIILHIAFTILVFLILLFLAMYLWEKVVEQKYKNAQSGKKR